MRALRYFIAGLMLLVAVAIPIAFVTSFIFGDSFWGVTARVGLGALAGLIISDWMQSVYKRRNL